MNISTLENTSISDILACFNLSFSDYLIPLQLSEEQLKSKLIADNTNLSKSIGRLDRLMQVSNLSYVSFNSWIKYAIKFYGLHIQGTEVPWT